MVEKHLVNHQQISGEVAFKLYDTYGFPLDLLKDIALERGVGVDVSAFEELLIEAKSRSKQGSAFNDMKKNSNLSQVSAFIGHDCLKVRLLSHVFSMSMKLRSRLYMLGSRE